MSALLSMRLARVAMAGAASAAVDFAVFNALLMRQEDPATIAILGANTLAFACAMVVNYTINARFSFGVQMTRRNIVAYVVFTLFGLVFYNVNLLWIRGLTEADSPLTLNASKVAAMGLLVIWNYFGYQRFVFRDESPER